MKIGYFINHFPYLETDASTDDLQHYHCGGAENAAYYLSLEMAKRGHDVTVFTTSPTSKFIVEENKNIKILRYGTNLKIGTSNISWKQLNASIDRNFDLIHTHFDLAPCPLAGLRYAKRANLPLIITYHGDWVDDYGGIIRRLGVAINNRYLVDKILNYATCIISPSKTYIDRSRYLIPYKNKTIAIPNGVNINDISVHDPKNECRIKAGLPTDGKIVLFFGFLAPYKGPDILVKSLPTILAAVPNTKLIFAGKGVMRHELEKISRDLGVENNILFKGYIEDELKPFFYASADVFVLPSIMATECYPLTILESMACGTPIVASEIGGIPDSVENYKNGFLCKPNDENDLAQKIIQLLTDKKIQENMTSYCLSKISDYSWEKIAEQTESLYEEVLH